MSKKNEHWAGDGFIEAGKRRRTYNRTLYVMSSVSITCAGVNWFNSPEDRVEFTGIPAGAGIAMLGIVALNNAFHDWLEDRLIETGTAGFDKSLDEPDDFLF
ncbi:MAG: hypothetical protein V4678_01605 [Patescibacteria group bacterium]